MLRHLQERLDGPDEDGSRPRRLALPALDGQMLRTYIDA
jgi:hypothetical protein